MIDPNVLSLIIKAALILTLTYLAYIDWQTFRLPNRITLPLIVAGLLFNWASEFPFTLPASALMGASLGYISLWLLNAVYRLLKHRNGIGMGDAKLLAALGAWLGVGALANILLISSILGILGGLFWLKWNRHKLNQAFPFGPFLAIAGIIELLWPQIIPTLLLSNLI